MPHIILEYSSNVVEDSEDFSRYLFPKIHNLLTNNLGADINACKSRSIRFEDFYLCDDDKNKAFIFFEVKILPGRSKEKIDNFSQNLLELAKDHFFDSLQKKNLAISINIVEMENYNKLN